MDIEIWKDIAWFELYQVSNFWRVRNIKRNRVLSNWTNKKWYSIVSLFHWKKWNRLRSTKTVHRLVLLSFSFNNYNKPQINHINWIRNDNRLKNLEWCTASENVIDAYKRMWKYIWKTKNKSRKKYKRNQLIIEYTTKHKVYTILSWRSVTVFKEEKKYTFKSITEFSRIESIDISNICKLMNWKRKSVHWYTI